jgi:hypothetical protein
MTHRRIDQLQSGMEVARDVMTPSGQCLLRSGSVLTAATIALLAARGLSSIEVKTPEDARPTLAPEEIERIEKETDEALEAKYVLVKDDPRMALLRPIFRKWILARRLAR